MKVVLDTNILIASIGKRSPYRKIFDAFLNYQFTLLLSNDVLMEYLEVIQRKTNTFIAENILMSLLSAENTELQRYFIIGI